MQQTVNSGVDISIIIPIYNAAECLDRCLQSVQNQTFKNFEVILVNDGSLDASGEICKRYMEADTRFHYVYQENSGVSRARNVGLQLMRGKYFTFIDSDDWVETEYCQKLYDEIESTQADIAFCGIAYWKEGVRSSVNENKFLEIVNDRRIEYFLPDHDHYIMGSCWRTMYRSAICGALRFEEDLHIYEDLIFLLTAVCTSKKMVYVTTALYNYDLPTQSYFTKYYRDNLIDICYTIAKRLQSILEDFGLVELKQAELFKEYALATRWICDSAYDKRAQFKVLKKHPLSTECLKCNYTAYKQIYVKRSQSSGLGAWLLFHKQFALFYRLRKIKNRR